MIVFFFKQKTAYEMRISDWSSDVCSSDLGGHDRRHLTALHVGHAALRMEHEDVDLLAPRNGVDRRRAGISAGRADDGDMHVTARQEPFRSEEHTSELQSLMRSSYAVFCLKKKKKHKNINNNEDKNIQMYM